MFTSTFVKTAYAQPNLDIRSYDESLFKCSICRKVYTLALIIMCSNQLAYFQKVHNCIATSYTRDKH